jgi:hypothetical protein
VVVPLVAKKATQYLWKERCCWLVLGPPLACNNCKILSVSRIAKLAKEPAALKLGARGYPHLRCACYSSSLDEMCVTNTDDQNKIFHPINLPCRAKFNVCIGD